MCICIVCGYNGLESPQYESDNSPSFVVCSCCGFQAGFDDDDQGYTIESYRKKWIEQGAQWFDESKEPKDWNVNDQLKKLI